jgi:hypothetical protein
VDAERLADARRTAKNKAKKARAKKNSAADGEASSAVEGVAVASSDAAASDSGAPAPCTAPVPAAAPALALESSEAPLYAPPHREEPVVPAAALTPYSVLPPWLGDWVPAEEPAPPPAPVPAEAPFAVAPAADPIAPAVDPIAPPQQQKECTICFLDVDSVDDLVILAPCGHRRMCVDCTATLMAVVAAERKCPLCSEPVLCSVARVFGE